MPVTLITTDQVLRAFYKNTLPLSFTGPAMTEKEFDDAASAFDDRFKVDGTRPIDYEERTFPFTELTQYLPPAPHDDVVVVIHYGLEGYILRYGFSFIRATRESGTGDLLYTKPTTATHMLKLGKIDPVDQQAWADMRARYMEHVHVWRGNAPEDFQPFVAGKDAEMVIFPWRDELLKLYDDNTLGRSGRFQMVIDSISLEHEEEEYNSNKSIAGHRHGVAIYMEHYGPLGWERLLANPQIVISRLSAIPDYRDRAADYGNLCPVRCGRYTAP